MNSSSLLFLLLPLSCSPLVALTDAFQSSLLLLDTIITRQATNNANRINRFRPSSSTIAQLSFSSSTNNNSNNNDDDNNNAAASSSTSSTEFSYCCYSVTKRLSRENAEKVMDGTILPSVEYDKRIQYGGDAQEFQSQIVTADDPRTAFTYGEFSLKGMDDLIDLALDKHSAKSVLSLASSSSSSTTTTSTNNNHNKKKEINLIDLGSGCGRLVLYSALTRGFDDEKDDEEEMTSWTVHGIEISSVLHDEAVRASRVGVDNNCFQVDVDNQNNDSDNDNDNDKTSSKNRFCLHLGPAKDFPNLFEQADIIFAYSTVWDNEGFSPELGAIVMSNEWNELLSTHCRHGTIAITTDRVLDPNYGWQLVDRLDVDNREVFGSTGYIHILDPS